MNEDLDRFLVPYRRIYLVYDSFGRTIGEIHPRHGETYVCSALCLAKHHKERCSRTRGWKGPEDGEPVEAVHRVLIQWLIDGLDECAHKSTADHMAALRA